MVELLIVMGVSLFGLAGLMSVYTSTSRANNSIGHSAEAIDVCERTMEGLRSTSITNLEANLSYGGVITTGGWGPTLHENGDSIGRNGVIFRPRVSAIETTASAGLVRLQVDVSWADDGGDPDAAPASTVHSVTLEMIRTRVEAL